MSREWFELSHRKGRPIYLHSRTQTALERSPDISDHNWSAIRNEFFGRFPRAKEIRILGEGVFPTNFVPNGYSPVFAPGDRLCIRVAIWRKELRVRVAGVQMPLFGDMQVPSYVLEGGEEIYWDSGSDRWMFKSGDGAADLGIAAAARFGSRVRRKSEQIHLAA